MATSSNFLRIFRLYPQKYKSNLQILHVQPTRFVMNQNNNQSNEDTSSSSSSSSDEEDRHYDDNIKKKILAASLPFVLTHGWSKNAIGAGAESLGYSSISRGMFHNSGIALIHFFQETCNEDLNTQLKSRNLEEKTERDALEEIESSLQLRLRMLLPYLSQWPEAMALMASPPHAVSSLRILINLADDICYHAGDKSVDMTWYKHRVAVSGLYVAGELSLIQDKSPDFTDTWAFLSRRIEELRKIKQCDTKVQASSKQFVDISKATVTTLRNILGISSYSRSR